MPLYFSEAEVASVLPMQDSLRAVEDAFRQLADGRAVNGPRRRVRIPRRMLHALAAGSDALGFVGVKAYATGPGGNCFVLLLFEQESGALAAIMEADALGRIRTGAATAVAARWLAAEDADVAAIIGCGFQAETQLEGLVAVRPIRLVRAYCRTAERRTDFARRMSERLNVEVVPAGSAEEAARGAGIVVTATTSREPVLFGDWLAPDCFVAAVGGNALSRRELDAAAVSRADRIVVDDREQAALECGDLADPDFDRSRIETLAEVVAAGAPPSGRGIALFESQGIAACDVAVGALACERLRPEGRSVPGSAD